MDRESMGAVWHCRHVSLRHEHHISATVDGLSERSVSPVRYPSTSAPRPRPGPAHRTNAILQAGILDHRESNCPAIAGPAAPGGERKFLLHSRFASRTAKSGHRRAAVPTLAAHQAVSGRHGRCHRRAGSARCRRRECESRRSEPLQRTATPGPGPTTTVQIATIRTPASNFRTDTAGFNITLRRSLGKALRIKDTRHTTPGGTA